MIPWIFHKYHLFLKLIICCCCPTQNPNVLALPSTPAPITKNHIHQTLWDSRNSAESIHYEVMQLLKSNSLPLVIKHIVKKNLKDKGSWEGYGHIKWVVSMTKTHRTIEKLCIALTTDILHLLKETEQFWCQKYDVWCQIPAEQFQILANSLPFMLSCLIQQFTECHSYLFIHSLDIRWKWGALLYGCLYNIF